jgi:hypothetical protein
MTDIGCQRCRELLDDFSSDELLVETTQSVLRHLATCGACHHQYEQRREIRVRLRRALVVEMPAALRSKVCASLAAVQQKGSHSVPSPWWRIPKLRSAWLRTAAVAVLLACAGLAMLLILEPRGNTLSAAEVFTRADESLARLAKPGYVFYRRWQQQYTVRTPGGATRVFNQTKEEWAEGASPRRLASCVRLPDGRVVLVAWTTAEKDGLRVSFFNAGIMEALTEPDPQDAVPAVYVWPTDAELERAAALYPADERERLLRLARTHYPTIGNHAMYAFLTGSRWPDRGRPAVRNVRLSGGGPGLQVSLSVPDGSFSSFRGRPFKRFPASFKGEWTFSANTFLIETLDREWTTRNGVVIDAAFRADAPRLIPAGEIGAVFTFVPPAGTPRVPVDATELLRSVGGSMRRVGEGMPASPKPGR